MATGWIWNFVANWNWWQLVAKAASGTLSPTGGNWMVKEHAKLWHLELKPQADGSRSSAPEGVEAAISAGLAEKCNRAPGQELSEEEEAAHADLVRAAPEKNWRHGNLSGSFNH